MRRGLGTLFLFFAFEAAVAAWPVLTHGTTQLDVLRGAAARLAAHEDPWTPPLVDADPAATAAAAPPAPYLAPPLLAVLLVPAARLSPVAAGLGWAVLLAAALAAAVLLLDDEPGRAARTLVLSRTTGLRALSSLQILALLAILFPPFAASQAGGQPNALALLCLALARGAFERRRGAAGSGDRSGTGKSRSRRGTEWAAGGWLGLSLALDPVALLVLPWLVLTRRWRALTAALVVGAGSFLSVLPFLGPVGVARAARSVARNVLTSWPEAVPGNISLAAALDRLFPLGGLEVRHAVLGLAVAALTIALLALRPVRPAAALDACVAAVLLGAGASWIHQSAFLFPALVSIVPVAPAAALAVEGLYAVAASWRLVAGLLGSRGASPGTVLAATALTAATGTVALAVLWLRGLLRRG